MSVTTEAEIQQWLDKTKLDIAIEDFSDLEETAKTTVFSRLASVGLNTATWVDANTTPSLARKIVSLYVAAWVYQRAYSEQNVDTSSYTKYLASMADRLLDGITTGLLDIPGIPVVDTGQPAFYPSDKTSALDYETVGDRQYKFSMGDRF